MRGAGPDRRAVRDRRARRRRDHEHRAGPPRAPRHPRGDRRGEGRDPRGAWPRAARRGARRRRGARAASRRRARRRSPSAPAATSSRAASRRRPTGTWAPMIVTPAGEARLRAAVQRGSTTSPTRCARSRSAWRWAPPLGRDGGAGAADKVLAPARARWSTLAGAILLVNDCYNANPVSMRAALDHLASLDAEAGVSRCSARCASSAPTPTPTTARSARTRAARASARSSASASWPASTRPTCGRRTPGRGRRAGRRAARPRRRVLVKGSRAVGLELVAERARAARRRRPRGEAWRSSLGLALVAIDRGADPDRRHGGDADHDLPRPEVHRLPAGARVRPADPRGGAAGAPRQGGHADDGRADHLPGDRRPVSGSRADATPRASPSSASQSGAR